MTNDTSIRVSKDTRVRLSGHKENEFESFDKLINRILDVYESVHVLDIRPLGG